MSKERVAKAAGLVAVAVAVFLFGWKVAAGEIDARIAEAERRGMREAMRELDNEYQKCPKCWCPPLDELERLEEVFADVPHDLDDLAHHIEMAKKAGYRVRNAFGDTIVGMREP